MPLHRELEFTHIVCGTPAATTGIPLVGRKRLGPGITAGVPLRTQRTFSTRQRGVEQAMGENPPASISSSFGRKSGAGEPFKRGTSAYRRLRAHREQRLLLVCISLRTESGGQLPPDHR